MKGKRFDFRGFGNCNAGERRRESAGAAVEKAPINLFRVPLDGP